MKYNYESVLVFLTDLDDAALKEQIGKVEHLVDAHGGKVTRQDVWGKRQLAYKIKKKGYGIYVLLEFEGDLALVADLDRQLRINDTVLRHLIVKRDKYAPALAPGAHPDDSFAFGAAESGDDVDGLGLGIQ